LHKLPSWEHLSWAAIPAHQSSEEDPWNRLIFHPIHLQKQQAEIAVVPKLCKLKRQRDALPPHDNCSALGWFNWEGGAARETRRRVKGRCKMSWWADGSHKQNKNSPRVKTTTQPKPTNITQIDGKKARQVQLSVNLFKYFFFLILEKSIL
jgi:hypothetical protein